MYVSPIEPGMRHGEFSHTQYVMSPHTIRMLSYEKTIEGVTGVKS